MSKQLFVDPNQVRKPEILTFPPIPVNEYQKTVQDEKKNFTKEEFLHIYRDMCVIREFETMLNLIKTTNEYCGVQYNHPVRRTSASGRKRRMSARRTSSRWTITRSVQPPQPWRNSRQGPALHPDSLGRRKAAPLSWKGFFDGRTLSVMQKQRQELSRKLASTFLLYGMMCETFARKNGFNQGSGWIHARVLHAVWHLPEQRNRRRQRQHRAGRRAL